MRVAITGGTGLIGSSLRASLLADGHQVHVVTRRPRSAGDIAWDPGAAKLDPRSLAGVDAVVNLAGAPIAVRWTAKAKREIRESRVGGTALLARTIAGMDDGPRVLVSGSAIGIYGDRGDEALDESSSTGADFLAEVAREWEGATASASEAGVRVALMRMGIALSRRGGMLGKVLLPFRAGVGGPLGSGRQWLSWIAMTDAVRAIEFLLAKADATGPFNITAPEPVRNGEFASALGRALRRPAVIPTPAFALRVMFGGEMVDATLLGGQRVLPARLVDAGFVFRHPGLSGALEAALREEDPVASEQGATPHDGKTTGDARGRRA
jgi:uncharacterized protein